MPLTIRHTRFIPMGMVMVCLHVSAAHATEFDAAVKAQVQSFLANTCRVGVSVAVVDTHGGKPRFYDDGLTSRTNGKRPTPETLYEIASVTKTFTGVLAARALTEGRMTLDGDFRNNLPGDYPNLEFKGHPITLRTLATHTSGMPRDIPDTDAVMNDGDYVHRAAKLLAAEKGFHPSDFPAALHNTALRSEPGKTEQYSNAAMKVIAMGLEHAYGAPFETLVDRNIIQPLHMQDTGFTVSDDKRERLAVGYGRDEKPTPYHTVNAGASWGLYSDTRDMARYVAWQLNESDPVIARAHALIEGTPDEGKGIIWNEGTDHGERMLWHGGGSFGMSSQVVLYPSSGQGFVLLANDACEGTEGALKSMAMALHDHRHD